jgi:16S rRNA (adenine1518-N6/adenine1519-N6)-dimethyltransferase
MLNARQVKDILRENNLSINKKLGQNFLINEQLRDRIIDFCNIKNDDIILEIGPGLGALTEKIAQICEKVVGIEKDKGLAEYLKDRFEIIDQDILAYDFTKLSKEYNKNIKVIGNLPYYITSPIIFYLLDNKEYIDSIYITVQKEVADRIVAIPGSKDYGILSCSIQYHTKPTVKIRIPKSSFFPQPDVDSAFLELKILKEPSVKVTDERLFFNIIRSAFNQRRKTLFNAISNSPLLRIDKYKIKDALAKSGLDTSIRGERLSLTDFAGLTDALK